MALKGERSNLGCFLSELTNDMILDETMAKKFYVLDTSVYLSDYKAIYSYGNNDIAVPLIVLEEIDKHKKRPNGVGINARSIIRTFDNLRENGSFQKGIRIRKGSGLIFTNTPCLDLLPNGYSHQIADHQVIAAALTIQKEFSNFCTVQFFFSELNFYI